MLVVAIFTTTMKMYTKRLGKVNKHQAQMLHYPNLIPKMTTPTLSGNTVECIPVRKWRVCACEEVHNKNPCENETIFKLWKSQGGDVEVI